MMFHGSSVILAANLCSPQFAGLSPCATASGGVPTRARVDAVDNQNRFSGMVLDTYIDIIAMHMHRDETVARRHTQEKHYEAVDVAASSSPSNSSAGAGAGASTTGSAGTFFHAPSSKTCQTFGF